MNRTTKRSPRQALVPKPQAARKNWQLQEAKARISEVFRLARESGPRRVTKYGRTAVVVVLPAEEYERLSKPKAQRGSLAQFFADSPLAGSGVPLDRSRDLRRAVKL